MENIGESCQKEWHCQELDVPPEIEKTRQKLAKEAAKRPAVTLTELQEFLARLCTTCENISYKITQKKNTLSLPKACIKICYGLKRPRLNLLATISNGIFDTKTTLYISKRSLYPQLSEWWWWQYHAGLLFFSWNCWDQHRLNYEQFWILVTFSQKIFRRLLERLSPFNMTTTPKHIFKSTKHGFIRKKNVLKWSCQTLYLNSIENMWVDLKMAVNKRCHHSSTDSQHFFKE